MKHLQETFQEKKRSLKKYINKYNVQYLILSLQTPLTKSLT